MAGKDEGCGCLSLIIVAVLIGLLPVVFPSCMPVGVGYTKVPLSVNRRNSLMGIGGVVQVCNRGSSTLHNVTLICSDSSGNEKEFTKEELRPNSYIEIGWLEGWTWQNGEWLKLSAAGHRSKKVLITDHYVYSQEEVEKAKEALKATPNYLNNLLALFAQSDKLTQQINTKDPVAAFQAVAKLNRQLSDSINSLSTAGVDAELVQFAQSAAKYYRTRSQHITNITRATSDEQMNIWRKRLSQLDENDGKDLADCMNSIVPSIKQKYNMR